MDVKEKEAMLDEIKKAQHALEEASSAVWLLRERLPQGALSGAAARADRLIDETLGELDWMRDELDKE